jgi:hypothetical protein
MVMVMEPVADDPNEMPLGTKSGATLTLRHFAENANRDKEP